jgi:hypothetical protein
MCQYAIYCSDGTLGTFSVASIARHDCPLPYSRSILASSSSNLACLSSNLAYLTYSRVAWIHVLWRSIWLLS